MERRHIKWLPLLLAGLFFAYQYFSSEKFVNPETGRKSHVGMSTREEASLGVQSYQQVLAQSESINSGPELEMIKGGRVTTSHRHRASRCRFRLAGFPDPFFAGKRVLSAGRQDRGLHRHFTRHAK